jgi:hypothetical protein
MIALVKRAQEEKTKSEKQISTFEKVYVYAVILLSLFVIFATPMLGWLEEPEAFRRGVIVLVVASPCALVASITPALLSTLSHAAKKGILIKRRCDHFVISLTCRNRKCFQIDMHLKRFICFQKTTNKSSKMSVHFSLVRLVSVDFKYKIVVVNNIRIGNNKCSTCYHFV